jgi:FtsP/CotA-like multicopper oxidase with cupredoxin domain
MGPAGPTAVLINGQVYRGTATENPTAGTIEEWVIVNLTADTHTIHTHLVTFQLVSRQPFQATKYNTAWLKQQIDPTTNQPVAPPFPTTYIPTVLNPAPYYQGKAILPTPTEMGWKDTLQMNPGEVTTIRIRFTSQDGSAFANLFDPTYGPGYVWHCHIIDHEDNEMMRPLIIQ